MELGEIDDWQDNPPTRPDQVEVWTRHLILRCPVDEYGPDWQGRFDPGEAYDFERITDQEAAQLIEEFTTCDDDESS
jgi:hypothetical protein